MSCAGNPAPPGAPTGCSTESNPNTHTANCSPAPAAHRPANLGYAGRRCLVSRKWTGKTLTAHRADRRAHVMRALGAVGIRVDQDTPDIPAPDRYRWEAINPADPNQPDRTELLLRAINQRRRWRAEYEQACSATDDQGAA